MWPPSLNYFYTPFAHPLRFSYSTHLVYSHLFYFLTLLSSPLTHILLVGNPWWRVTILCVEAWFFFSLYLSFFSFLLLSFCSYLIMSYISSYFFSWNVERFTKKIGLCLLSFYCFGFFFSVFFSFSLLSFFKEGYKKKERRHWCYHCGFFIFLLLFL